MPNVTAKVDWSTIRREYVANPMTTLRELAKKHGVSMTNVAIKCKKEEWIKLRGERTKKELEQIKVKWLDKLADRQEEANNRHLQISKILQELGADYIQRKKFTPRNYREAKETLNEGVALERQVLNIVNNDKQQGTVAIQINFGSKEVEEYAE